MAIGDQHAAFGIGALPHRVRMGVAVLLVQHDHARLLAQSKLLAQDIGAANPPLKVHLFARLRADLRVIKALAAVGQTGDVIETHEAFVERQRLIVMIDSRL
jgi:hypothetical protein